MKKYKRIEIEYVEFKNGRFSVQCFHYAIELFIT